MSLYGSPEFVPPPGPQYEQHYCKHCQCQIYGNYCPICGRALSKKAKRKLFLAFPLAAIVGVILFVLILGIGSIFINK